jgi:hypothetical protein
VRVKQERGNVWTLTMTGQECSALIAGARMALDALQRDERAPDDAVALLERTLADYDAALRRGEQQAGA